ncbi:MAG TPA: HlyD family secretion protein, partial [Cyanobacteria bacterium UBA11049]|nr:HlyD family secretion protein [Cyanobacteria bacterium UBA11049]
MGVDRESQLFTKSEVRWRTILTASIAFVAGLVAFYSFSRSQPIVQTQPQSADP